MPLYVVRNEKRRIKEKRIMGLAASQARLLQLTTMLNDCEFEGQQINNARTKLSTTSASFYSKLLEMEVPTPPSKSDYTNLEYTFKMNGNEYTISDLGIADKDGNTTVGLQSKQQGTVIKPSTEKGTVTEEKTWVVDKDAKENGYDYFTTTLSISPYKNAAKLNEIGNELATQYGIAYLYSDFKKKGGYLRSCQLSDEYGLYRQDYCGCIFSKIAAERKRSAK